MIPANEIYDVVIEITDMLKSLISVEHFRSRKNNPDLKMRRDDYDELGNPRIIPTRPKDSFLASDELEIKSLEIIIQDLISLKRNRRPTRSITPKPQANKSSHKDDKRDRRKRYFYTKQGQKEFNAPKHQLSKKEKKELQGISKLGLKPTREKQEPFSPGKWYEYIG